MFLDSGVANISSTANALGITIVNAAERPSREVERFADTAHSETSVATYNGSSSSNTYRGTSSADTIKGNGGNDLLYGNGGNDSIYGGTGNDTLYGGIGNDRLYGEAGNDRIYGEAGNDIISGGDGIDVIAGADGRDRIWGDAGADRLYGGIGNDDLYDGSGNDLLDAGDGNDLIVGGGGIKTVYAGSGDDRIFMPYGYMDETTGDQNPEGSMTLLAGLGNDVAYGGHLGDNMRGEAGNDQLSGGAGDDRLDGGAGNDLLYGDFGADRLIGGDGNDVLHASDQGYAAPSEGKQSILTGGGGRDTFEYGFSHADDWIIDHGYGQLTDVSDVITDFTRGEDKIEISSGVWSSVEGTHDEYDFKFSDLDTSGNGVITGADQAVSIGLQSFMGEQKSSLTIDVGTFGASTNDPGFSGSGTITLFSVTALTATDFA
jgi:Ca2+-binding RTX toxin-like protein